MARRSGSMTSWWNSSFKIRRRSGKLNETRRRLVLETLEGRAMMAADIAPYLDIRKNPSQEFSRPGNLVDVSGTLFFSASSASSGDELWRSDGASGGFIRVKDVYPGPTGSLPRFLTNVNGTLFFTANDGVSGLELWKSDGTASGTTMVLDLTSDIRGPSPVNLTNVNGTLYFSYNGRLWKSDGTDGGTVSQGANSSNLANVNGTLFFNSSGELNKLDPTTGSSVLVKDIFPGSDPSNPSGFVSSNAILYFVANDGVTGNELWKSDGTESGTVLVKDIANGPASSSLQAMTAYNGGVLFSANDGVNGNELWRSDGTEAGTSLTADISPGGNSSSPRYLTNFNGTLFFTANDGVNGSEIWKSDGSNAGTTMLIDLETGLPSANAKYFLTSNGKLVFTRDARLWASDGTANGTTAISNDIGTASSAAVMLASAGDELYFAANGGVGGRELWKTDGTASGTGLVKDLTPGNSGFLSLGESIGINGTVFFGARTSNTEHGLWKSDGTEAGTELLQAFTFATPNSTIAVSQFKNVNGTLFFRGRESTNGYGWWKSDGTVSGTQRITSLDGSGSNSSISNLTEVNGTLFYTGHSTSHGFELWKSDGTSAGTSMVKDIFPGSSSSGPSYLFNANGTLYFRANDGVSGSELWKSDGTASGTSMVRDISTSGSSFPCHFAIVNGTIYFNGTSSSGGTELWKTDGTVAGTRQVRNIAATPSLPHSNPSNLTNVNGTLFFLANDGVNGIELWKSNGTVAGTVLVKDIIPGAGSSSIQSMTVADGQLFFTVDDGVSGREIWKSDGTSAGTSMIMDIAPGSIWSNPSGLVQFRNHLYFAATTDRYGTELYRIGLNNKADLMVPLYRYPTFTDGSRTQLTDWWEDIRLSASALQPMTVIINPSNGPIDPLSTNLAIQYQEYLAALRLIRTNPHVRILGYLPTGYGSRSTTEINDFLNWYSTGYKDVAGSSLIDGIFLDEYSNDLTTLGYYRSLRDSIRSQTGLADNLIVGNTGVAVANSVFYTEPLADVFVSYENVENPASGTVFGNSSVPANAAPGVSFGAIIHSVPGQTDMQRVMKTAKSKGYEYVFVTDDAVPNPFDEKPLYWNPMTVETHRPVIVPQAFSVPENTVPGTIVGNVPAYDPDPEQTLTYRIAHGNIGNAFSISNEGVLRVVGPLDFGATPAYQLTVEVTDSSGDLLTDSSIVSVSILDLVTSVVGQRIFYNRSTSSVFGNGGGNPTTAIDVSKSALLPGQTATFSNVTNYSRGINGIVVDVWELAGIPTAADFQFATSTGTSPLEFTPLSAVPTISLLSGGGESNSSRIKIEFEDNTVKNTWLRVTLLANAATGLTANHVFYFGNAVGEMNVGNLAGPPAILRTNASDTANVRQNQSPNQNSVGIDSVHDINKDGRVNATDTAIVRQNQSPIGSIAMFTAPLSLKLGLDAAGFDSAFADLGWLESFRSDHNDSQRNAKVAFRSTKVAVTRP